MADAEPITFAGRTWTPVARVLNWRPDDRRYEPRRLHVGRDPRFNAPAGDPLTPPVARRRLALPTDRDTLAVLRSLRQPPPRFFGSGTPNYADCYYAQAGTFTAVANTASETSLLTGANLQPTIYPPNLLMGGGVTAKAFRIRANGILSTTATPTMTFKFYLATSLAALTGLTIGATAAITTASGVSNKRFSVWLDMLLKTPGQGATAATLYLLGEVESPAGFASPFAFTVSPGTGDSVTVSGTLDGSVTQYFNMSLTWSAASASNTATLETLTFEALN